MTAQHSDCQAVAVYNMTGPVQQLLRIHLYASSDFLLQTSACGGHVAYLTEGQSSNGRGDVVAVGNGQHGSQQDEGGSNEVQPQTQPLVSCLQRPVCPASRKQKP